MVPEAEGSRRFFQDIRLLADSKAGAQETKYLVTSVFSRCCWLRTLLIPATGCMEVDILDYLVEVYLGGPSHLYV